MTTYREYRDNEIKSKVYNTLAQLSHEEDIGEQEMKDAIKWFMLKFYEKTEE